MATGSSFLSADQSLCSVCVDVVTDPVTVPCGHSFCKSCITDLRSTSVQQPCPVCKELFGAGTWRHLEPHRRVSALRRHKLDRPVPNLEDRLCKKHERPLEMFCRTDQMSVCQSCAVSDHKRHQVIPLREEGESKKEELKKTGADVQLMIRDRLLKLERVKQSVKLSREDVEDVTAAAVDDCAALIKSARRTLDLLVDLIQHKQKAAETRAEGFIKELEEEISELVKKNTELKSLSQTEEHLQLLQNLPPLKVQTRDWTNIQVESPCDGTMRKAAAELETLRNRMKKLCAEVELSRARLYSVDVTLDPDTADPYLVLSEDQKQVSCGDVEQVLPYKPQRLSSFAVLGEQGFSSGRFYYEVQVGGKTKWELGVVRESINRKGGNTICPENGYWAVWLRSGHYRALAGPSVPLCLESKPQKVGVFVDYNKGLVCFYDPDAAASIYSFTKCKFRGKLFPYLSPCSSDGGKNSNPLIISTITSVL